MLGIAEGVLQDLHNDHSEIDSLMVVNTKITGTLYLLQRVGRDVRVGGSGRILITGSIAGFMPGTYQAVNNGTKRFSTRFRSHCATRSKTAASRSPA